MSKIQTLLTLTFIGLALVISAIQGCGKSSSSSSSSQPTVTLKGGTSEWITPYSYSHYTPYSFTQWVTLQRAISTLTSSKVKVFKFAVSRSTARTQPITIFSDTADVERDLLASSTFGSGQASLPGPMGWCDLPGHSDFQTHWWDFSNLFWGKYKWSTRHTSHHYSECRQ